MKRAASASSARGEAMKITSVEVVILEHGWGHPDEGVSRRSPLVFVHTDAGITGYGRGGDPKIIREELAPLIVGQDARRVAMLWRAMHDSAWRFRGPGRAAQTSIGAVDTALWDAYGKSCGEPVWRMLGGFADSVSVYADGIGYVDQDAETVARLVAKHAAQGYEHVKFHLSGDDDDIAVEKVRLAREAVGAGVRLMLDAHRMWDGARAAEMARRLAPYDLYWIEEPVRGDDEPRYYRMVREAVGASATMIAGGEGEGTLGGARRLITEGGLQLLQTDILVGGGFTGLMRFAALAAANHIPIAPHGAQYPDISSHLAAAAPNCLIIPACPDVEPYEIWSKLYNPRFEIADGKIRMSERPGLGLELDWDFVSAHRIDA